MPEVPLMTLAACTTTSDDGVGRSVVAADDVSIEAPPPSGPGADEDVPEVVDDGGLVLDPSSPLELLLIEDNPADRVLIEHSLKRGATAAFHLTHAQRLEDGREWLLRRSFDCVLLDLTLPDGTGLETVEAVHQAAPEMPIVVLSGLDDDAMAVASLEHGVMDYLTKGRADPVVLWRAVRYAMQRKRSELKLRHRALHDPLTELANRTLFVERLTLALARMARSSHRVGVLFLDLDRFKWVNDTFGHDLGDRVLIEVANRLRNALRPNDLAARLGGDEFIVLCEDLAEDADAHAVGRRIEEVLSRPLRLDGVELRVASSIGIAIASDPDVEPEVLLRDADAAMYAVKVRSNATQSSIGTVGSRVEPPAPPSAPADANTEATTGAFVVHYQPIVDVHAGTVRAVEAMLCLEEPPSTSRPAIEALGTVRHGRLGVTVVDVLLHSVVRDQDRWAGSGADSCLVGLTAQHVSDPALADRIAELLVSSDVDAAKVCLVVDEATLAQAGDASVSILLRLKQIGVRLALGSFGAGPMSLSMLRSLPLDMVTLDAGMLVSMGHDAKTDAIVRAVVDVAASLGLDAVGRGLRDAEQVQRFTELGGRLAQGAAFGPTVAADELPQGVHWPGRR